jgi:hypothetical protein
MLDKATTMAPEGRWVDLLLKAQEFHAMRADGDKSSAAGTVKIRYKIEVEL